MMKFSKKITALFAVASMIVSSAVTASAAFSTITVTGDVTAEVGETITLEATYDTLVGAKALTLEFWFDADAFTVDTTDNVNYDFGRKLYYPNYVSEGFLKNWFDYLAFQDSWSSFDPSYNAEKGVIALACYDTKGTIITDELEKSKPYKTVGVNLTTVKDGTYTVTVKTIVSDNVAGDISSEKTIKVVVGDGGQGGEEGGEGEVTLVAGVEEITTEGRHQGKASFSASTGVATTGLTKITVKNSTDNERVEEWEAPATYGDGSTKVLPIVTYNKNAGLGGSIFTVDFYKGSEIFKTLTYTVPAAH